VDTSNNSSVVEYYSKNAERFANAYSSNLGFRERYEIWCRLLDKYSSDKKSAIDMGCGSGAFTFYLASKRLQVTGIDASETMIELCKNEQSAQSIDNIQFHTAVIPHFRDLPLHKADLIISSSVLEYVENLEEALTVFHKLLNDDGVLIVSFPNANSLYRKYERWQFQMFKRPEYYRYVKNVVSAKDLELLSRSVGMSQLEVQYYAHDTIISRISRFLGFPPEYTENLFVSVFRKDRIDARVA
jgi:2-polyprenyl-6-hydroxyphenyl methylase/3-demethylubiquinone-9 3-methyltransferase